MTRPRLPHVARDRVPTKRFQSGPFITHHHGVRFAVPIHVRDRNIVCACGVFIEHDPLEQLLARFARIAIPDAAANQVDPSVAILIQRSEADQN